MQRPEHLALLFIAAAAIALAPLAATGIPPLVDYPNHLARMAVLADAGHDPHFARMFTIAWAFIPNLAMDLIVPPLIPGLGLELAGRVYVGLAMALPCLGCVALHRRLHPGAGAWLWPFLSFLLTANAVLTLGLLGFAVGIGAALLAAAVLLRAPGLGWRGQAAMAAACGVAVFVCHIVAWALLCWLLATALPLRRAPARWLAATVLPIVVAPVVLHAAFGPAGGYGTGALGTIVGQIVEAGPGARTRLLWLASPFSAPGAGWWSEAAAAILPLSTLLAAAAFGRVRLSVALLPTLFALALGWAVLPTTLADNGLMFQRMVWPAVLVATAATAPELSRRAARAASCVGLCLLLLRAGSMADDWRGQDALLADIRVAAKAVPPGGRVLAVRDGTWPWQVEPDETGARRVFHRAIAYAHLPALLVVERHAFWPMMFTAAGKSPLRATAAYDPLLQHDGPLPLTRELSMAEADWPPQMRSWRTTYDYVLRLNPTARGAPALDLTEVAATPFAILYRVAPPAPNDTPDGAGEGAIRLAQAYPPLADAGRR